MVCRMDCKDPRVKAERPENRLFHWPRDLAITGARVVRVETESKSDHEDFGGNVRTYW